MTSYHPTRHSWQDKEEGDGSLCPPSRPLPSTPPPLPLVQDEQQPSSSFASSPPLQHPTENSHIKNRESLPMSPADSVASSTDASTIVLAPQVSSESQPMESIPLALNEIQPESHMTLQSSIATPATVSVSSTLQPLQSTQSSRPPPLDLSRDRPENKGRQGKGRQGRRPDTPLPGLNHPALSYPLVGKAPVVSLKKTEVWAWYFQNATYCGYGWVSAVMMVPLLIQDVAARNGVEASNHALPCDMTVVGYKCVMQIFGSGLFLDPGTISLYISSFSAVVSFIVSLSIAAVADHGSYRKHLLVVFAILGCLASVAFFLVQSPSQVWLTVILAPLGWACYNVSSVFSNAFLPIYVRVHPKVLAAADKAAMEANTRANTLSPLQPQQFHQKEEKNGYTLSGTAAVASTTTSTADQRKVEEQVTNDLSAWCAGAANMGSMIIMGICIGISMGMNNSMLSLQIAISFTGVWWLVWTLAVLPWLDARPGPPMPKGQNWIAYSWRKNYHTFKSMRQLSQVTKFIFAWFMLSDGVNTVTALLYVVTYQDLKFSHTKSLIMTITISAMAFLGTYLFLWIRKLGNLSTKTMVLMTLMLYTILTAYFVVTPYFTTRFGLRHEWEAWLAIVYLGVIISTFFGCARVMLSELCPEGDENEWFSIFQLADKGSSWIGPFVTGAIQSLTGEFRTGFWFPLALFAVGGALLLMVDVNRGKDEAIQFKQEQLAREHLLSTIPPITVTGPNSGHSDLYNQSHTKELAYI